MATLLTILINLGRNGWGRCLSSVAEGGLSSQYPPLLGMESQEGVDWGSPHPQHQLLPSPSYLPVPALLPRSGKCGRYGSGNDTESSTLRIRPHLVICLHGASFTGPEQREQEVSNSPSRGHNMGGGRMQGGSHRGSIQSTAPCPVPWTGAPSLGWGLHGSRCALVPVVTAVTAPDQRCWLYPSPVQTPG